MSWVESCSWESHASKVSPLFTTHFHSWECFPLSPFLTVRPLCNSLSLWSLESVHSELRSSSWPGSPFPSFCLPRDQLKTCTGYSDIRGFLTVLHLAATPDFKGKAFSSPPSSLTLPTLLSLSPTLIGRSGASFQILSSILLLIRLRTLKVSSSFPDNPGPFS